MQNIMQTSEVTSVSLLTSMTRDQVCAGIIPGVAQSLMSQGLEAARQPITSHGVTWEITSNGQITVALDEVDGDCLIQLACRAADLKAGKKWLTNVAAHLCQTLSVQSVFWDQSSAEEAAADFADPMVANAIAANCDTRIYPRRVPKRPTGARPSRRRSGARYENWMTRGLRKEMTTVLDDRALDELEMEERRAQSAPIRLSAWAMSISAGLVAAPLALPLIAHNLVRGEDVRAGGLALGVAGLYATLAHTGLAPALAGIL